MRQWQMVTLAIAVNTRAEDGNDEVRTADPMAAVRWAVDTLRAAATASREADPRTYFDDVQGVEVRRVEQRIY
mgnify:CR=1 FL=1